MKKLIRSLILVLAVAAPAAQAAVVFQDLGTAAPPATMGGFTMQPFNGAAQAALADLSETSTIPGSPVAGTLTTSAPMQKRTVPTSWSTWSHGYTGPVFYSSNSGSGPYNSVTLTLPANARAFYFYAEPNSGVQTVTATTDTGATSGPVNVTAIAGANGFGFVTTAGEAITTITVTLSVGQDFALAEFGISAPSLAPAPVTPVPTLSEWGMIILSSLLALASVVAIRRQRQ